jgi:hypothetical protein
MGARRRSATPLNIGICRIIVSTPNRIRTGDLLRERQAS